MTFEALFSNIRDQGTVIAMTIGILLIFGIGIAVWRGKLTFAQGAALTLGGFVIIALGLIFTTDFAGPQEWLQMFNTMLLSLFQPATPTATPYPSP